MSAAAVGLAACGLPGPPRTAAPRAVSRGAAYQAANRHTEPIPEDGSLLPWARNEPYVIVVRKSCGTLDVYRFGVRIRSYPAVFGLNPRGHKLHQGDFRTPSGFYMIIDKRPHPRWARFLLLDYPNVQDLHRYWLALRAGDLPQRGDGVVPVGGAIGIHGTDHPGLNRRGVNWTWGCISLLNRDVEELARLVPVGTLVLIEE